MVSEGRCSIKFCVAVQLHNLLAILADVVCSLSFLFFFFFFFFFPCERWSENTMRFYVGSVLQVYNGDYCLLLLEMN